MQAIRRVHGEYAWQQSCRRSATCWTKQEVWYLPIFGVFHPQKPDKIGVVFDAATKHEGLSLNDMLLTRPDLTNNLAAVLTNFRRERFAAMADVEQMFFNFDVHEEHRNFLRIFWFKNNDTSKPLVEYLMREHVFGNSVPCCCKLRNLQGCVWSQYRH